MTFEVEVKQEQPWFMLVLKDWIIIDSLLRKLLLKNCVSHMATEAEIPYMQDLKILDLIYSLCILDLYNN